MATSAEMVGLAVGVGLAVLGLVVGMSSSEKPKPKPNASSSLRRRRAPHVVVEQQTPSPQTTTTKMDWNRYFEKQIRTLSAMKKEFQKNAKNDDMDKENFATFKKTYVRMLNTLSKHESALWSCLRESMRETRGNKRTQFDTLIREIESLRNQAFQMPMNTVQDVLRFGDKATEQLENMRTLIRLVGNATYDACFQQMVYSFISTSTT